MPLDGDVTQYTDKETAYDTAFAQLSRDSFTNPLGFVNKKIADIAFEEGEKVLHQTFPAPGMGAFIEERLGQDLLALQQPGKEQEYSDLVQYVNEVSPSNEAEMLSVYKRIASPETYSTMVLAQAGVEQPQIESFLTRLNENEGARATMGTLIEKLTAAPAAGASVEDNAASTDITQLSAQIKANAPMFQAIAANPDSFLSIAANPALEPLISKTTEYLQNGGSLDKQGIADVISGFSLQEKTTMLLKMGGATEDDISAFQGNLDKALEINPQLETVIDNAVRTSIISASSNGPIEGDLFAPVQGAAEMFTTFATSKSAETLLTDKNIVNHIVEAASQSEQPLDLMGLKDVAVEQTILNEAGIAMAVSGRNLPAWQLMLGGSAVDEAIEQAKGFNDIGSLNTINGTVKKFMGTMDRGGMGGFIGGIANSPLLSQLGSLTMFRHGIGEMSVTQSVFAQMDRSLIFDGSNGYPAVDYAKIGEVHRQNTYRPDGSVRPEDERGKGLTETLTSDAKNMAMNLPGADKALETAQVLKGSLGDGLKGFIPS